MVQRASVALVVVVFLAAPPAFGWGWLGHRVVAAIGQERMSDPARAKALALLGGKSFADVANQPDDWWHDIKSLESTQYWHYVNIPRDATYDHTRDCSPPKLCVIDALDINRKILQDPHATKATQRQALIFIIHFVGDLHQPLHCTQGKPPDGGGNLVKVAFFGDVGGPEGKMNLHKVWDSEILTNQVVANHLHVNLPADEAKFVTLIKARLAGKDAATIAQGTPAEWAESAHEEAAKVAYPLLPHKDPHLGRPNIQQPYVDKATPVIDDQLLFGGIRLAKYLDGVLGN